MTLAFFLFFFPETNIFILLYFAVHYAPDPSSSLFGFVRGMNRKIYFQFQGQASLFSAESTLNVMHLSWEGWKNTLHNHDDGWVWRENRTIFWQLDFLFQRCSTECGSAATWRWGTMGLHPAWRSVLSPGDHASLSPGFLPIRNHIMEDDLVN